MNYSKILDEITSLYDQIFDKYITAITDYVNVHGKHELHCNDCTYIDVSKHSIDASSLFNFYTVDNTVHTLYIKNKKLYMTVFNHEQNSICINTEMSRGDFDIVENLFCALII